MKHRLIEFLATEMGFTIFSIEASMTEAYKLNEYIVDGKGDPKALLKGLNLWIWNTQEVLDMIEWMKRFNESGKGRIQFTGFDMLTHKECINNLNDFFDAYDPGFKTHIDSMTQNLDSINFWNRESRINAPIAKRVVNQCNQVKSYFSDNIVPIKEQFGDYEFNWLVQNVDLINQRVNILKGSLTDARTYRDMCMADNVSWILKNNPDSKIVLWAHNGHVWREKGFMGNFLHAEYSNNHYNIGFLSNTSTYTAFKNGKLRDDNMLSPNQEGSFEYSFNKTNIPMFHFDFSQLNNDPNCKWMEKSLEHRVVGSLAADDDINRSKLSSLYNAVIYIDKTDASKCFSIRK